MFLYTLRRGRTLNAERFADVLDRPDTDNRYSSDATGSAIPRRTRTVSRMVTPVTSSTAKSLVLISFLFNFHWQRAMVWVLTLSTIVVILRHVHFNHGVCV